jgi:hypothetical protein
MQSRFEIEFLPGAVRFMNGLDAKAQKKIYYNIRKAQLIKTGKTPKTELEKAELIRKQYLQQK